jgi:hypothetical protein
VTRDPFRRPPMVDIPAEKRESWWTRASRRLAEARLWYAAAEQSAREQGWPDADVEEIAWYRGRAERKRERFVHDNPAPSAAPVPETPMPAPTRSPSSGYVPVSTSDPELARIQKAQNQAVNLARTAVTDQERQAAARATEEADALRDEALERARRALERHRQQAAATQPPEPPVGTVLETSDAYDTYQIERTDDGWHVRYREDEDPSGEGRRLTPGFGGRGVAWPAAWSAWGPPSGAEPFRPVSADSPLLPAHPEEDGDGPSDADVSPDASDGRFEDGGGLPPAAEPHVPPRRRPPRTPHPESPATTGSTGSTTGGTGMAGIEEAREGIMTMHRSAEQGLAELEQAHSSLEDAQNGLRQGTEGSNQAEADQAHAQLADAMSKIDEARQQVAQALQEFEGVATRL